MNDAAPSAEVPPLPEDRDPLSVGLRELHLTGVVVYCQTELGPDAGVDMPAIDGSLVLHLVTEGEVLIQGDDGRVARLRRGDLALLPRARRHQLLAHEDARADPLFGLHREHPHERIEILRHGLAVDADPGRATGPAGAADSEPGDGRRAGALVCAVFQLGDLLARRLAAALPAIIVLPAQAMGPPDRRAWLIEWLATELREAGPGSHAVVARIAELLLMEALRTWLNTAPEAREGWLGALADRPIGEALRRLHEQPGQAWTLERLAREVGLSRTVFAERFRQRVGQPMMRYLTDWRMQMAQSRLETEDIRLATLADDLGYESEASFSRAFKRWSGRPPGEIARQARPMESRS